jgi:hypothetical protein
MMYVAAHFRVVAIVKCNMPEVDSLFERLLSVYVFVYAPIHIRLSLIAEMLWFHKSLLWALHACNNEVVVIACTLQKSSTKETVATAWNLTSSPSKQAVD